jgi:translation initiation factor 6
MTHLYQTAFQQNPNVGLSAFANDNICILAPTATKEQAKQVEKVLQTPILQTSICGTSLAGVFIAGNNHCILLPKIILDEELDKIQNTGIPYHILETDNTALGNNIVATDDAALINKDLKPFMEEIKKHLKVKKIRTYEMADIPIIGALVTINKHGCLLSAAASESDEKFIKDFFGVPTTRGTVNLGSPYVKSGIVTNSNGFLLGNATGGPEAVAVDEALGFLK